MPADSDQPAGPVGRRPRASAGRSPPVPAGIAPLSVPECRAALAKILTQTIQGFYSSVWDTAKYDQRLRQAVAASLNSVGATGLLVKVRQLEVGLYCPAYPAKYRAAGAVDHDDVKFRLEAEVRARLVTKKELLVPREAEAETGRVVYLPVYARFDANPGDRASPWLVAALLYRPCDVRRRVYGLADAAAGAPITTSDLLIEEYEAKIRGELLPLLADAFRHRDHRFAAFAPLVIERYWVDAPGAADETVPLAERERLIQPPWSSNKLARTASLSIDLRKSTYCMEFAQSEKQFGDWLDQMVEKMRHITHQHGGVFDKFTGDGALVHFLERECRKLYDGRSAVDAAVHCAADMQRAVEIHMKELRRFLRHDSERFGAGIAIDVADAFWSADHRENPIVVGKGVVGACRVGDKAPRKAIRFTNLAYHQIDSTLRGWLGPVEQKSLPTKESADDLPLLCWEAQVDRLDPRVGNGVDAVEKMCSRVRQLYDARRRGK